MAAPATPATLALPAAGGDRPRHVLSLATLFLAGGVLMFYAALVGAYVHLRGHVDPWPPEGTQLDQYLGNMLVVTMLLSAVTVEWGYAAVRRGVRRQASAGYGTTIGLGLAFLVLLWHTASHAGYGATTHAYGTVVAAMAVVCGILVALGVAFVALTLFRAAGSQVSAAEPGQARATAWYWHVTVVASVAVWYTVVVLK